MIQSKHPTRVFCLIFILIVGLTPMPGRADEGSRESDKPIRLYATALAGPIGTIESLDAVAINGRTPRGDRFIWGGELIQASANNSAIVSLESVGQVTLKKGAVARLATAPAKFDDESNGLSLVASLAIGDITVKLHKAATAYVEAGGSVFTASRGATFRVGLRDGQPLLEVVSGDVQAGTQGSQVRYIRPIGRGLDISVRARGSRQLQVRVTDENDKPLPDIPVIFALGGGGVGTLAAAGQAAASTLTVTTAANGIATVSFTAATTPAAGTVTASVSGAAAAPATGTVTVSAATAISTGLVVGIAAAAAGGTAAAIVIPRLTNSKPIKESGPTTITPNFVTSRRY